MNRADRKAELASELEWSRAELARGLGEIRSDLNLVAHVKQSVINQKTAWFTGAAITGWILSRLPARRKSASKALPAKSGKSETGRAGLWLALIHFLFNIFKPALTKMASQKVTRMVGHGDFWE